MTATAASLNSKSDFIIYAFEKDEMSKGSPVWQALKTMEDEEEACHIADILFRNEKFTRIEVRRKGEVIKVFDTKPPAIRKLYFMLFGAAFCIISAGLITIYQ